MRPNKQDLMRWLADLGVDHSKNTWYNQPVYHTNHIKYLPYFDELKRSKKTIEPKNIIGITHGLAYNYVDSYLDAPRFDWSELLVRLKRIGGLMRSFKDRDAIIEHVTNNSNHIQVEKYGNHYFSSDGQHRLCLAKFFDIPVDVEVVDFCFNKKKFIREMKLQKYLEELSSYGFDPFVLPPEIEQDTITLRINNKSIIIKKAFIPEVLKNYKSIENSSIKRFLFSKLNLKRDDNIAHITNYNNIKNLNYHLALHLVKKRNQITPF